MNRNEKATLCFKNHNRIHSRLGYRNAITERLWGNGIPMKRDKPGPSPRICARDATLLRMQVGYLGEEVHHDHQG